MNWYKKLEPKIRPYVKLLRDNGINTTNSCEHDMSIDIALKDMAEVDYIGSVLIDNAVNNFTIEARLDKRGTGYWLRTAIVFIRED